MLGEACVLFFFYSDMHEIMLQRNIMHVSNVRKPSVFHVHFKWKNTLDRSLMFVSIVIQHIVIVTTVSSHSWNNSHWRKNYICKQFTKSLNGSGLFAYIKRFIEERVLSYLSTMVKPSVALLINKDMQKFLSKKGNSFLL